MKKGGIVVLSLFDGMSCGRIAFDRAGIKVKKYYASEIDKYAQIVSEKNYPDIVRLGDITKWREWKIEKPDIIIGGSPCQGFSFAGKGLNFDDPRNKLFFTFADILKHYKPQYFLLENVKMKQQYQDIISGILNCEPVLINSALVSAQDRERLYWCNWDVCQPKDKNILLNNILEKNVPAIGARLITRRLVDGVRADYNKNHEKKQRIETRYDQKTGALTSVTKDNIIVFLNDKGKIKFKNHKSNCIDANYWKGMDNHAQRSMVGKFDKDDKLISYRKLTPIECERLQTVPDNYTAGVSTSQRYKMLGNGWTVDAVSHIFKSMNVKKEDQGKLFKTDITNVS